MKKKFVSILLAVMLAVVPFAVTGCKPDDDEATLRFWGYGDQTAKDAYTAMVNAYNAGQGKTDGVTVRYTHKEENGYVSSVEQASVSKTGPDVFFAWDRYFKKWANQGMLADMQSYVDASEKDGTLKLDDIWHSTVSRFRYNRELNISNDSEDVYGLPVDTSPTALFYNKTAMTTVGVKVISVAEADLAKWNNNEIADKYGKKKSDLEITVNVPAKGYYRSDTPYVTGTRWEKPEAGTTLVFNDQIAMNWDEIEDLGHLMTKHGGKNNDASTDYGYYTEWWFNYGWAVGGDCVVDMSGNGSWSYSHGDSSANYIVNAGKTYTGAITGKVYQAGETLEFLDKMDVEVGDTVKSDDKGGYTKNGSVLRTSANPPTVGIRAAVIAAATDGTLTELPSIREAFSRFCRLAGSSGKDLNICPYPTSFSTTTSIQYFTGGKVGMIVERGLNIPVVNEYVGSSFDWSVAPLPVFKEYTEPTNPECVTVKRQGKTAGHSESTALAIREKSEKKDASWKFVRWMVGPEAQKIKASYGFIPNQESEAQPFYDKLDPSGQKNLDNFINAAKYETPGDWWYMVNKDWIDVWASPLNSNVRNGRLELETYLDQYVSAGNREVERYGNYDGDLGKVKNYNA